MQETVTVKNGSIPLPKSLQTAWKHARLSVRRIGNKVTIEGPAPKTPKYDLALWKQFAGSLKGRITEDPVKWQRRIRKEWERKLPWPK